MLFNVETKRCVYVFSVSSIFVCPKYLATNVTLAPLLMSSDAHGCLKSWILITFNPARVASLVLLRYILESAMGLASETLFGVKFERYLHQQAKAKTIQDISLEDIRRAKEMRNKQNG